MICKLMNKFEDIICFIFCDDVFPTHKYKYNLKEVFNKSVFLVMCILIISWWSIPGYYLVKKYNELNIKWPIFRCDKK